MSEVDAYVADVIIYVHWVHINPGHHSRRASVLPLLPRFTFNLELESC